MDITKLKRDPKKIHAALKQLDDGRLITLKTLKIYIPCRFAERNLAVIGLETRIVGIYAIVDEENNYGVSLVNAMMEITPTSTIKITINGNEYYEFTFDKGSVILPSVDLVKIDTLVYNIYDEIIAKGHVPWYLEYNDLGRIFDTAMKHAGARVGDNHEVIELLISMISRDKVNRHKYYRQVIESLEDLKTNPPAFIPLRSVIYNATNTTNKLAGSYLQEGMVSALVTPSTRQEHIEQLLVR